MYPSAHLLPLLQNHCSRDSPGINFANLPVMENLLAYPVFHFDYQCLNWGALYTDFLFCPEE